MSSWVRMLAQKWQNQASYLLYLGPSILADYLCHSVVRSAISEKGKLLPKPCLETLFCVLHFRDAEAVPFPCLEPSYIPEQLGSLLIPGTAQDVLGLSTCFAEWAVPDLHIAMSFLRCPKHLEAKRRELQRTSLTTFCTDTWWSELP